jgi:hypothetical protein
MATLGFGCEIEAIGFVTKEVADLVADLPFP